MRLHPNRRKFNTGNLSAVASEIFFALALGNLFVTVQTSVLATKGGSHGESVSVSRFMLYVGMTFVVAILFSIVASFYRYRDEAAAEGR